MVRRWEQGQALSEYVVLLPIAILVSFFGLGLTGFIGGAFEDTLTGLQCSFGQVDDQTDEDDDDNGNTNLTIYNHSISLAGAVYDEANNTTTVTYMVTSGSQPSISHWTLGIPLEVWSRMRSVSEQAAWTNSDPTTGAVGVKFDTGYEPSAGGGGGGNTDVDTSGGNTGGGNGGNGIGNGRRRILSVFDPKQQIIELGETETRYITITFIGEFEFEDVTATTKAGQSQVGSGPISAPVRLVEEEEPQEEQGCTL
jgi:hypothetical protein